MLRLGLVAQLLVAEISAVFFQTVQSSNSVTVAAAAVEECIAHEWWCTVHTHKAWIIYQQCHLYIHCLTQGTAGIYGGGGGGGSQCVWYMWNVNVKIEGEKEREKKRENQSERNKGEIQKRGKRSGERKNDSQVRYLQKEKGFCTHTHFKISLFKLLKRPPQPELHKGFQATNN